MELRRSNAFRIQMASTCRTFVIGALLCLVHSAVAENTTLLFVQMLFRHGARAPMSLYNTDPNPASSFAEGLGKLTKLGKQQHYALGKYFRSRYNNFANFTPLEVSVQSSAYDRCVMSAASNLASFFAPDAERKFEPDLLWQPVSVQYAPLVADPILTVESYCPRADEEIMRVNVTLPCQKFAKSHKEVFQMLTNYSGCEIRNWNDSYYLYDTLSIEKMSNLTIPAWVDEYYNSLKYVSSTYFIWSFNSTKLLRLRVGPLLGDMIRNMERKIGGETPHLKFKIYSSHDANVAGLLTAFGLYNNVPPPFASTVLMELHAMPTGEKAVRLLYLNSTHPETRIDPPHLLTLKGCSEFCPLPEVVHRTRHLIPRDWEKECGIRDLRKLEKCRIALLASPALEEPDQA